MPIKNEQIENLKRLLEEAVMHVLVLQGAAESLACIKEHAYSRI